MLAIRTFSGKLFQARGPAAMSASCRNLVVPRIIRLVIYIYYIYIYIYIYIAYILFCQSHTFGPVLCNSTTAPTVHLSLSTSGPQSNKIYHSVA